MGVPDILRNRDFRLFWGGVVVSQVGTRGALAANLYQVYDLTGSVLQTGLVGTAQAVAVLVLSPVGGVYADRVDRRRLLQWAQVAALLVAVAMAALTLSGRVEAWQIVVCAFMTTAASTFDSPARQALIPAMVPAAQLPRAFALVSPSREIAVLVGPALAGLLIVAGGPGLVYVTDAVSYLVLVVVLALLHIPRLARGAKHPPFLAQVSQGFRYVVRRPIIWRLIGLDLSATVLGAYRVLMPALAADVLHVGAGGYGFLAAAPSAGALLSTHVVFRTVSRNAWLGAVVLVATAGYGASAMLLAQSPIYAVAVLAAGAMGGFDAAATSIRHAVIQLEVPDELRGRVTSIYQMASRGGPAVGDASMGAAAALIGPVLALSIGGCATLVVALAHLWWPNVVRSYGSPAERPRA